MIFILALFAVSLPSLVLGYSSGPPISVCKSRKPGHGPDFQAGKGPFTLVLASNFKNGHITVDIKSTGKTFEGFLLQARDCKSDKAFGSFIHHFFLGVQSRIYILGR